MTNEERTFGRCVHLSGVHKVRICTKLGTDCPSPKKCVEMHGDKHYKPVEFKDNGSGDFWGF